MCATKCQEKCRGILQCLESGNPSIILCRCCVRFCMVSYCGNTRRIGVGAKNGSLAVYDLKQSKCQVRDIM